jgi:asparagine synthase (glutamine-hydrolysing)
MRKYMIGPMLNIVPDGGWYKSKAHQLKWLQYLSFLSGSERYARSLSYFYFGNSYKDTLYGAVMRESIGNYSAESSITGPFESAHAKELLDRMLYSDTSVRLPDHPVMITDRMTMAHSLEARSPLMDHVVAEFAAKLPTRLKVKGRNLRYIQHRLAERYLPKEVLERPKQGFSSALPYMLKNEYIRLYKTFLQESCLASNGILSQSSIDRLLAEQQSGHTDHGNRLWLLLNSEAWYRMHMLNMIPESMTSFIYAN